MSDFLTDDMVLKNYSKNSRLLRPASRVGGFTLIEILLVITIILMLAGALVVYVLPQQKGAEKNTTRLLLNQVQSALDTYRLNIGSYPTEEQGGLGALLVKPTFENEKLGDKWQGPYLKPGTKLEDAWGNKIRYELVDKTVQTDPGAPDYKLYSVGPDGIPDTDDDIKLFDDKNNTGKDAKTVLDDTSSTTGGGSGNK
ncbi:MAG TPA: type II secretion system major pseudopilin GspG [Dongiaceae bacterium]|nr:type II secretion system major pseudopilin GspG [Dongiaceae bacterium]